MSVPAVGIEIVARLDKFREEMAKLGPMAGKEGKAIATQLSREIKAATKAMEAQTRAARGTAESIDDTGKAAKKLRGIFSGLSPEVAGALGTIDDMADAVEGVTMASGSLGAGLAVVGTAVAAGYLAWRIYNDDTARAEVIAKDLAAAHEAMAPILDHTRDATIDLAEATGQLSEEEAALERNSLRAFRALQQATSETTKKISDLRKEQGGLTTQIIDAAESYAPAWTPLGAVIRATTTDTGDLDERIGALEGTITAATAATREDVKVTGDAISSKIRHKEAVDALAKAERELWSTEMELRESLASREGQLREERTSAQAKDAAEGAKLMAQIEEEQTRAREEETKAYEEALDERLDARRKAAEEEVRIQRQVQGAYSDIFGAISSFASSMQEGMSEDQKDAARAAFAVQQAAAAAQVAINTITAVSEASTAAPYPFNIPLMVAAGAVGIAQEAAIASTPAPSFGDTPGVQQMGSSGKVQLTSGDLYAAAKTPADLRRQVGTSDSGRKLSARADDRWMRDHLRTNGVLATKIRGNSRVGHGP